MKQVLLIIYGESTLGYERVIGYDTSLSVSNLITSDNSSVEWLAEYEGAKGVVKAIYANSAFDGFLYKTDKNVEELESIAWDYIEIRVYVNGSGSKPDPVYNDSYLGSFAYNTWSNVRITKDKITDLNSFYNSITDGGVELFWAWNATGVEWYIDYVDFKVYNTDGVFDFSDPTSNADVLSPASAEWLSTFEGANGVIKTTYTGAYSATITIRGNTTVEKMQALDWEVLVVRVWFEKTEANANASKPDPVKNNWNINGLGTGPRGQWVSLCISKTNLATQFTDIDTFYNAFVSKSGALLTEVYNTQNSSIYIDSVSFTKYDRTMDFENEEEISFLRTGTDVKWLESATCDKGMTENGVLSYNHGLTQYAGIKLQFNNPTGMTADDWDTMEIRIRILRGPENGNPGTDASFGTLYLDNDHTWTGGVSNGWSTLEISKDSFAGSSNWGKSVTNFWSAFVGTDGAKILFESWYLHTQGGWTIQIDYISLLKKT